ncbi:VOC family protein [Geodermatophilus nigrescens]
MDFTDLFAGVRVRDITTARTWYERLLGSEPAFLPNDVEAVWAVGEHRWLYLLEDAPKSGAALVTIMVADLDATAEAIRQRGIEPTGLEDYGEARKYVFHDPDGNEVGIGQVPAA